MTPERKNIQFWKQQLQLPAMPDSFVLIPPAIPDASCYDRKQFQSDIYIMAALKCPLLFF